MNTKEPGVQKAAIQLMECLPKAPAADLYITFFGKFKVLQGNKEISNEQWKSRQAKLLFKFLAIRSTKGYTDKEILMDLLWPDENLKTASKRLHVVLAMLRKILEPDIPKGISSSYLVREEDGYRLNLGENGHTDVETFTDLLEKGLNETNTALTLEYYRNAESIYRDEFLEENPYEEWCCQERERFRKEYLNILIWLMDHHEENNDFNVCIRYAEKFLATDPDEEEIYRRLMIYHLNNNMTEKVTKIYERCRKHFEEELDSPVSPKTKQLHHEIVSRHLN